MCLWLSHPMTEERERNKWQRSKLFVMLHASMLYPSCLHTLVSAGVFYSSKEALSGMLYTDHPLCMTTDVYELKYIFKNSIVCMRIFLDFTLWLIHVLNPVGVWFSVSFICAVITAAANFCLFDIVVVSSISSICSSAFKNRNLLQMPTPLCILKLTCNLHR